MMPSIGLRMNPQASRKLIDAVIPSAAAKRRSRGTPAFVLGFLFLITGPSAIAAAQGPAPSASDPVKLFTFEVVSIRPYSPGANGLYPNHLPDGFQLTATLADAIALAYTPHSGYRGSLSKVLNAPAWALTDMYDFKGRVSDSELATWQQSQDIEHSEFFRVALQATLQDRAKLAVHTITMQQPCLNLVVGKLAPRLEPAVSGTAKIIPGKSYKLGDGFYIEDNGKRQFVGVSMEEFALLLTRLNNGHLVQDKTGLTGRYDFTLPLAPAMDDDAEVPLDRMPVISAGLVLKPANAPFLNIYIDHIEKPDAN
jgi:uncharacterized protein (TIGR03435 family)